MRRWQERRSHHCSALLGRDKGADGRGAAEQDDGAPAAFKLPWWQLAVNYSILLLLPQLLLADDALDQQRIVACIGHLLLGPPTPGEEEEGGMEKHNWLAVI